MKPLGLGMIGLHHQHPRWYYPLWVHLPQYRPLAIAEADEKFLTEQKGFFTVDGRELDAYTDYHEILGRDDIDVVIIWLPHSEMPAAVEAAAKAGKHVIVEKPCAANLAGAKAISDTAARYPDIRISAPYCWRTHPVSQKIRGFLSDGLLGAVNAVEARLNAGGAWRYVRDNSLWMLKSSEGGGPMWNLGVHWVDYFRHMTGKEVQSVCGFVTKPAGQPPRDIEDNSQAVLKFTDGSIGILDISYSLPDSYPGKRDIFVAMRGQIGDISWAPAWQGVKDEMLLVSEHPSVGDAKSQRIEVVSKEIPGYCGHMAWAWLTDFAQAVQDKRDPIVKPSDILAAVKVVDAFYRSVRSGKVENVES